jgi:signal transduction histidine kinase
MTASPVPAAPPRSSLPLAAIVLACCLTVYVIVVPLALHGSAVGWRLGTVTAVAAVAGIATVAMLTRLSRVLEIAREENARQAAQVAQLSKEANRQAEEMNRQAEEIQRQAGEISVLTFEAADGREREERLVAESAGLRDDLAKAKDAHARTVADAVRYTLYERIPLAIEGEIPPPPATGIDDDLAELLEQAMEAASTGADQQASMRSAVVALSRRVQASAHRIQEEATLMADRHPGDSDVLEVSMRVDHAAAQQARTAQSLAVLLGQWPGQQWAEPLPLVDVVRAAAGRIIAYRRIEVAGDPDIAAAPPVVEPLIHLLAELLANATQSSPPSTQVPVAVRTVQRGAVIEVHDCGVGLDDYRLTQARAVATGELRMGLEELGEFPQTGLAVVGQYVRRHGFRVDISESVYGGVRVVVGIPADLVETVEPAESTSAPVTAVPESRSAEADATTSATTRSGKLPRRQSPRHSGTGPQAAVAGTGPSKVIGPAADGASNTPEQSPEEAGAWMGAFLNSGKSDGDPAAAADDSPDDDNEATAEDNSTEQQEQA